MPIEVEVPGQGIVEFPDGMGDDEISSIVTRQFYPEKIEQKRDELAKETFQARLEGEQAKALSGLTDIGTEAAKAVVRAASHVDPTGFTQGLMQQYGVEPTHVIPPETFLPDVRTVSEVARKGVSGLGIDPNVILPEQYRKPAEEFVAETIASTPEMAPLLAAGVVDPRGVGRVFQAQMLQGVPQTAYAAATAPTAEERIKAGIQTGAGLAFPALIERGMRQPSVPIPDFIGRQLEMQRGAIPPRGEPVALIERVTPEQAAVAAERMSAPFDLAQPYIGFSTPKVEPSAIPREPRSIREAWQSFEKSATATPNELVLVAEKLMEEGNAPGSLRLPINIYKQAMESGRDPNLAEFRVLAMIEKIAKETPPEIPIGELKVKPLEKPDVTPTVTETAKPEVAVTPSPMDTARGIIEVAKDDRSHGDEATAIAALTLEKELASKGYNLDQKLKEDEIALLESRISKEADRIREDIESGTQPSDERESNKPTGSNKPTETNIEGGQQPADRLREGVPLGKGSRLGDLRNAIEAHKSSPEGSELLKVLESYSRKAPWEITQREAINLGESVPELKKIRNRAAAKAFQDKSDPNYKASERVFSLARQLAEEKLGIKGQNYNQGRGLDSQQLAERLSSKQAADYHRKVIEKAIKEGKPVPAEVLADYPDLKPTPKPAETPVEAAGKVEAEVQSVAQTEGARPAKEIKSELVERLEKAIEDAPKQENVPEYSKQTKDYQEKITIEIPGDGTFKIFNTKEQLGEVLKRAKRIATTPYDTSKPKLKPFQENDYKKLVFTDWTDPKVVPALEAGLKKNPALYGALQEAKKLAVEQPTQPITQGPGARTAQTVEAPESYPGTALKNATAEIERAGWGMAEAPEHVRQSIPEAWIRAGRTLERDTAAGQKLVDELMEDPKGRGLSVDESALLLRHKVTLSNEMNNAAERIHTAKTAKEKEKAEGDYGLAHERMLTMLDAIKNRGTAWGQEGRWRQVMAREDFSLATLITQREAALGRKIKPGTPEFEELKKHADRLQELNSKLEQRIADVEKEFQDSEVKRALAEARANANKELPYHPRILELAEGYAKKWDARGAKALEDLKAMFSEGQAFSGAPISPAMLDKAIIYGTSKMVRGAVDLAKWTDTMVKDLGEGFRKYAKDVYDASKRAFDQDVKTDFKKPEVERRVRGVLKADIGTETTLKQIAAKAAKTKEGRLPNINYYLRKLGRVYAREGIKEEGPFLDRMTADVQKVLPTLTRDDVRAIFGGYAEEVRVLSKEPVEVILRDMRGQSQELHKLSLLKQKIIPPKLQERATPSEKQRQLRKQVEAEKRAGGFAPPDPEVQLRSAMQSAETRLTNQITDLQREIDTGEKIVKQQRAPLKSEKLDALRERRDRLREIHDEVFKKPDLTDAERLEIWKERVKEQIDELRDRRQRGDFKPKPKPDPIRFDKQAIELQFLKEVEHRALMEMRAKDELSKRTTPEVIKDSLKNAAMFAHMAMAGGEFSAVFKQGATGAYSMPIRTARNFAKSLQAWWSEENQFKIKHEILTRDNAPFYRRDKLEFTDVGGRLSSMEEMYMFRVMDWMKKVPGLSHYVRYMDRFQRAFSTFLNLMRADTYDAMVREMGSSPEAGQSAANYINVATGRGSHSTARFGGSGANAIFFAPRWSISRFQYLLGQPILAAKPGYKKYIVKQYAKTLMGLGSVYALGYAMGGDVDWNPTSSKFGKIQIGNRVIDPLFGLAPVMRIIAQQITGLRKNYKGKVRPIREGGKLPIFEQQIEGSRKLGPYDPSGAELMGKFAWSKLAPAPEATVSAASGENVIGEKFSVGQKIGQLVTPITYRDVINAIREEGIDEKTAIDLMAIFGLSSYVEKPRTNKPNF